MVKRLIIIFLICISTNVLVAQDFADKDFYLVDSLDIESLHPYDLNIIDSCLNIYHQTDAPLEKIKALEYVTENMQNSNWTRYQKILHDLILKEDKTSPNNETILKHLGQSYINLGFAAGEKYKFKEQREFNHLAYDLAKKTHEYDLIFTSLNNLGFSHQSISNIDSSFYYYNKALEYAIDEKDSNDISLVLDNLGTLYEEEGNYETALGKYYLALNYTIDEGHAEVIHSKIGSYYETIGVFDSTLYHYYKRHNLLLKSNNLMSLCNSFSDLGRIHNKIGDYNMAIKLYQNGMEFSKSVGISYLKSQVEFGLGVTYYRMSDYDSALIYFNSSALTRLASNELEDVTFNYGWISSCYREKEMLDSALVYQLKSFNLRKLLNDSIGIVSSYNGLAAIYFHKGNILKAKQYSDIGFSLANKMLDINYKIKAASIRHKILRLLDNHKEALEVYETYIMLRDSIKNDEVKKSAIRQQTKYEFEKAQLVKEQQQKELARIEAEKIDRRNSLQYSVILVAILVVFGIVMSLGFIKVSPSLAEGLIFFAFLILFEFLLVLTDPFVDNLTNSEPMYKLLANALLAGLIFPAHTFFERVLKKRILKKNKE